MAASSHLPTAQNSLLSNRYDGTLNTNARQPSGPCNYTNLNVSGNGAKCGCRRFTDNSLEDYGFGTAPGRPGWCVCEHHSCFHSHDSVDGQSFSGVTIVERSPTPRQVIHQTSAGQPMKPMRDDLEVGQPRDDFLPNTQWGDVKFGVSMESLPAIPSQCLLPSENGSRASSSQAGNTRPFAGRGLNTLSHILKHNSQSSKLALGRGRIMVENGRIMQVYEDAHGHGLQSITDLATPSIRSSQDMDAEIAFSKNVSAVQDALQTIAEGKEVTMAFRPSEDCGTDPAAATMRNESLDDHLLPKIRSIMSHVADYPMTRRNHEHRLDQLENGSFSHGFIEDMRDQHELLETRVQDLETRMDDVEKQNMNQVDRSSIGSRQLLDASMDSRSSSALISSAIDRLDSSRIEALEAQILELQAAGPPSHSKPWEIEVVFLPFGPRMMGIWSPQNSSQRSRMNSASGDECTQTQHSLAAEQARLTTHNEATAWEKRMPDFDDDHMPWLMPRACGRRSRIDERLRSRGLVRKIQVKGPDARDVQAAMLSAFDSLPDTLAQDPYSDEHHHITLPESLNQYIGLQAPWIPLRKDHKISALRFLNIGEMLTPSLWTVNFLFSSVVMKASGMRRLYVTHPASYVQHLGPTTSWTWQKLRQLDRVYPDMDPNHTPEADAHEPCWEFDERYDSPPSLHASLTSQEHSLSIRSIPLQEDVEPTSPSDHFSSDPVSSTASTPRTSLPSHPVLPLSPLKERNPFRPAIRTRTISMPLAIHVPLKSSPSQTSKRPMTSLDHEHTSEPSPIRLSKRHRTRSPSRPRDTPRWSVGPPSPYAYVEEFSHKRGTTPFAYATPHSNAPYNDRSSQYFGHGQKDDEELGSTTDDSGIEGGDQNALSDFDGGEGDEWEGLQDQDQGKSQSGESDCPSEYPSRQPDTQGVSFGDENASGKAMAGFTIHVDEEVDD